MKLRSRCNEALLAAASMGPLCCGAQTGAAAGTSQVAHDAAAASSPQARIDFAARAGIVAWEVIDEQTLIIEGMHRSRYLLTLQSPRYGLSRAERIVFVPGPDGALQAGCSIRVGAGEYAISSLVRIADRPATEKAGHLGEFSRAGAARCTHASASCPASSPTASAATP